MEPFGAVTLWKLATSRLGIIVIGIAGVWVFYEGVPVAKHLRDIPVIGEPVFAWADPLLRGRVSRAYDEGQLSERLAWQEKARRQDIRLERERDAKQAKIDTLVAEHVEEATGWALERSALRQQIEDEKHANEKNADDPVAGGACRPAISRGVSRRLDAIGKR